MAERASPREHHVNKHGRNRRRLGTARRRNHRLRFPETTRIRRTRDHVGTRPSRQLLRGARISGQADLAAAVHRQQELRHTNRFARVDKGGNRSIAALSRLPVHAGERCALPAHRAHLAGEQERLRHPRHQHQAARLGGFRERSLLCDGEGRAARQLPALSLQRAIVLDRGRCRSRQRRGADQ